MGGDKVMNEKTKSILGLITAVCVIVIFAGAFYQATKHWSSRLNSKKESPHNTFTVYLSGTNYTTPPIGYKIIHDIQTNWWGFIDSDGHPSAIICGSEYWIIQYAHGYADWENEWNSNKWVEANNSTNAEKEIVVTNLMAKMGMRLDGTHIKLPNGYIILTNGKGAFRVALKKTDGVWKSTRYFKNAQDAIEYAWELEGYEKDEEKWVEVKI
jgi:hypothetical protein